tara:strand:+ start:2978 stop:3154 length:177 start_codon:yes stop_codon:yes gene_type:complete
MSSSLEIQVNDKLPLFETRLGCALLLSYKKDISSIVTSLELQEKRLNKNKAMINFFML